MDPSSIDPSIANWQEWIYPLVFFILSLPAMLFSTTSSRAISALGLARAKYLAEEGNKTFDDFVKHPNDYWMTIHILEVISVIMMFCPGYILLEMQIFGFELQEWAVWLILAGFYFVFHTALGIRLAKGDERATAARVIKLIKPFYLFLRPVTLILCTLLKPFSKQPEQKYANAERFEEELEVMLDESERQGGIENTKAKILRSAIDYNQTSVRELMIPRTDLTACAVDTKLDDALELYVREGYSRLPVYEGNIDTIVGVLYFKDIVQKFFELREKDDERAGMTIKTLVREATFVPQTLHIDAVFEHFKREHIHMAIVIDEFGGTAGLVTLEDIIEEFFGEIQDEFDAEEEAIVPLDKGSKIVLVDASTNISDIAEHFDIDIEENPDYDSVGGLVTFHLGHIGTIGEEIDVDGLHFVVRDANERCILQVEISKIEASLDNCVENSKN